ncbi:MAG: acylphosphatase [Desulfuromonadales bacterium]|nr:acylphosphatase [Desulfuromonadales bacterium]
MDTCVKVRVTGRVQGVWFRQSTKECADQHGVYGWCRNNPDGSVEAVFAGEEVAVNAVVKWCKTGPVMAQVDSVQVEKHTPTEDFVDFQIR